MLNIDGKNIKITKQEFFVGNFLLNKDNGYNINIELLFINIDTNEEGYINLDAGFEKTSDIKAFLNREYNGSPFDMDDDQFICFEIFDTEKFLDTEIESKIQIKLENIKNNKIKASFELNDELIKIKFDGYLDRNLEKTKETFI